MMPLILPRPIAKKVREWSQPELDIIKLFKGIAIILSPQEMIRKEREIDNK